MGQLVVADGRFVRGVSPDRLSLDMWGETNANARRLYEAELGFVNRAKQVEKRPTLEPVGSITDNGNRVFLGADSKGRVRNMVEDIRYFDQYDGDLAAEQFGLYSLTARP